MIQVEKSNVPQVFVDFVEHDNPKSWDDIHKSNRYPNVYADSRRYILEVEQGGVSAYTERCLYNSGNLHIDHFRKKGLNWPVNQTFVWANLFVDERSNNYGACYKDANTSDISDYNKMIDLAAEDPDDFFTYLANGEMIPKVGLLAENREKAVFTRDRFNLNFNALVEQRRNVLLEIDCFLQGGMTAEDILEVSEGMGFPSVVMVCTERTLRFDALMPTATAASGATCGQKINAAKGLINDNVDVNDNLAAPLLAKAAPQRLVASGE